MIYLCSYMEYNDFVSLILSFKNWKVNTLPSKIYKLRQTKGPFKYYVIKEVGGWGQKMAILDDLQYCKSSKSWVGGPKKSKTWWRSTWMVPNPFLICLNFSLSWKKNIVSKMDIYSMEIRLNDGENYFLAWISPYLSTVDFWHYLCNMLVNIYFLCNKLYGS